MKKTISVNLRGMSFLMEEEAYDLLKKYLFRLKEILNNQEGSKEIMEDIELRIAELCSERLNDKKQVIELSDIQGILKTLGDPDDYANPDDSEEDTFDASYTEYSKERRLFRDLDQAKIAGVCAGIANYLNVDVVIIRIVFAVLFFGFGFGLPLYILLWIIIPKAQTTIDKLRMRGKPITVDSVRQEVENAANRINKETKSFSQKVRNEEIVSNTFHSLSRVLRGILGSIFFALGMFLLILFLFIVSNSELVPVDNEAGMISAYDFLQLLISNQNDLDWFWNLSLLSAFTFDLFLLINGTKLIFNLDNKWSKSTTITLFLTAFLTGIIAVGIGAGSFREMKSEGELEKITSTSNSAKLYIEIDHSNSLTRKGYRINSHHENTFFKLNNNTITLSGIHMRYKYADDSLFHIHQTFTAHGKSHQQALLRAGNIHHTLTIKDSVVQIAPTYSFPKSDLLRDQEVYIIIEVPRGKSVIKNGETVFPELEEEDDEHRYDYYNEYDAEDNW